MTPRQLEAQVQALQRQVERLQARRDELWRRLQACSAQLRLLAPDGTGGRYCGVYVLTKGDQPVYAGQSVNVLARLASHRLPGSTPTGGDFDSVRIQWCDAGDLDVVERRLIAESRPSLNILGASRPYMRCGRRRPTPAQVLGHGFAAAHAGVPRTTATGSAAAVEGITESPVRAGAGDCPRAAGAGQGVDHGRG
jgi:hypothetical protein